MFARVPRASAAPTSGVAPALASGGRAEGESAYAGGRLVRDHLAELFAWFLLGVVLMSFLYAAPAGQRGLPGNDSFYHLKMALLLPEIGLPDTFDWLTTTIFTDEFVSHHYGFHVVLAAGVRVCALLGAGDPMQAARWFNAVCFGGVMLALNLLLIAGGVRHRPVWLVIFLLLPNQFFARHMYIRAMCPSLLCMLAILLAIMRGRHRTVGVLIFLYIHLYFGALLYTPVLVGAFVMAGWLDPASADRPNWRLPVYAAAGWLAGLVIHPYGGWSAVEFLQIQVFGSGLDPDIPVGREWKSYTPAWFFVQMSAAILVLLGVTLCVRGRRGPRFGVAETALLIINFAFLLLTLKARRFIEYWPMFSLLSCAYLWRPMHAGAPAGPAEAGDPGAGRSRLFGAGVAFGMLAGAVIAIGPRLHIEPLIAEWRLWLAGLSALAVMAFVEPGGGRVAGARSGSESAASLRQMVTRSGIMAACAAVLVALVGGVVAAAFRGRELPLAALALPPWLWVVLGAVLAALIVRAARSSQLARRPVRGEWGVRTLLGASLCLAALLAAAGPLVGVQRSQRCKFNLAAVSDALGWIADHSAPGEIIFTDDWDTFGVFFYCNHRNRYIVGLDPKFTHARDPVLWEKYVRITRANVPSTIDLADHPGARRGTADAAPAGAAGAGAKDRVRVTVDDILTDFGARWAIVDADHVAMAQLLHRSSDVAVLSYSTQAKGGGGRPLYQVFRMRPPAGSE